MQVQSATPHIQYTHGVAPEKDLAAQLLPAFTHTALFDHSWTVHRPIHILTILLQPFEKVEILDIKLDRHTRPLSAVGDFRRRFRVGYESSLVAFNTAIRMIHHCLTRQDPNFDSLPLSRDTSTFPSVLLFLYDAKDILIDFFVPRYSTFPHAAKRSCDHHSSHWTI